MQHIGWESYIADQDLWMNAKIRPDNGHKYYAYVLLYVDDICNSHQKAELCLWQVDKYFKMTPGSIGDPDFYLAAMLKMKRLSNGVLAWNMSSSMYIQEAVQNVKDCINMTCPGQGLPQVCLLPDSFHLCMFPNWICQLSSMIRTYTLLYVDDICNSHQKAELCL
jgi:hypothetical protein